MHVMGCVGEKNLHVDGLMWLPTAKTCGEEEGFMTRDAGLVTNCATCDMPLADDSAGIQICAKLFETLPMTYHAEICSLVSRARSCGDRRTFDTFQISADADQGRLPRDQGTSYTVTLYDLKSCKGS
jgi:hypothetical protein